MTKSNWFDLLLPPVLVIHFLANLGAYARLPSAVDFYVDPLMPRANDTLVLEADRDSIEFTTKYPPKKNDYRWYYRELGSPVSSYRLIGVGPTVYYNITRYYRDGFFNLSVIYCCNPEKKLESIKLIRMQRPISIQVFLNGSPLPGNQSESFLRSSRKVDQYVNLECRISGMPTSFVFEPPLGVACLHHKDKNKRRYLALIRRRCRFLPGILRCSAKNDISHVTMLHFLRIEVPRPNRKKGHKTPSDYDAIEEKEERSSTYILQSEGMTVSGPKGNKNTPVIITSGQPKKNTARQCNCCTTTVAVATLTWLASVRH